MGRRIPNWVILAAAAVVVCVGLAISMIARPLPEYLVAAVDLKPGSPLTEKDFKRVPLQLGELGNYMQAGELPSNHGVIRVLRKGELLSALDLTSELDPEYTAIRITPELQPAGATVGAFVSVWQAIETETGTQIERLVDRAEVLAIEFGEGLFAEENPAVELRVQLAEAVLIMRAIANESAIFVVPIQ